MYCEELRPDDPRAGSPVFPIYGDIPGRTGKSRPDFPPLTGDRTPGSNRMARALKEIQPRSVPTVQGKQRYKPVTTPKGRSVNPRKRIMDDGSEDDANSDV